MHTSRYIKSKTVFLVLIFLLIFLQTYSQQTAPAAAIPAEIYSERVGVPGTAGISLPIKVRHFTGSNLSAFALKWDPSVMTFIKVERLGSKGMTIDDFNVTQAGRGILMFSPKGKCQALADGSVLVALKFKAIGNAKKNTQITVEGQSLPIGSVSVGKDQTELVGIQKFDGSLSTTQAYPNPFVSETRITFNQPQQGIVSFSITDLNGKLIKHWSENKTKGIQEIVWKGTGSGENIVPVGIYILTLKYNGIAKTIKLIKKE